MGRKIKATVIAVAIVGGTMLTPAAAQAAPSHQAVAASAPCSGRSMPVIFQYGASGFSQFFWWFATGCKP